VALVDDLDDLGDGTAARRGAATDEGGSSPVSGGHIHHLDDLGRTLDQRGTHNGCGFLQDLDDLHGGGGVCVFVATAAAAARNYLNLVDLGSSLVGVAAAIRGTGGVADAAATALLVDHLDDLDGATRSMASVPMATTSVATASVATASSIAAQADARLQARSTAATTASSEETQEASVGHSEQSTHANEDLEGGVGKANISKN